MIRARHLLPAALLTFVHGMVMAQPQVRYFWSGALTDRSIRVNVQLTAPCDSLRLVVDDDPSWTSPFFSPSVHTDSSTFCMVPLEIDGLAPNTPYRYRFEVNGVIDTTAAHTGSFGTAPEDAGGFSFVTGSCSSTCTHPVWESMRGLKPLFLLEMGDLHYADIADTSVIPHRQAYEQLVLGEEPGASFFRDVPIAYMWDDHDFCSGGSQGNAPGRYAAHQAYREYVPHYPLAQPADTTPIDQAFTIGRVHFIVSDMRSAKTDGAMMNAAQRSWLHHELLEAQKNKLLAVWVSSLSWNPIGYPENWGSQEAERTALSDFLRDHGIRDLLIICGDAHMLAIDSGANGDFSTGQNNPWKYPVFQAAAINRGGSYKGGTYDQGGYFVNPTADFGQFGRVQVDDDGTEICVTLQGYRTDSMGTALTLIDSYSFCRTPNGASGGPSGPTPSTTPSFLWVGSQLTLRWGAVEGSGTVELVDAGGRLFRSQEINWTSGRAVLVSARPAPGTYVLRLACGARQTALHMVVDE